MQSELTHRPISNWETFRSGLKNKNTSLTPELGSQNFAMDRRYCFCSLRAFRWVEAQISENVVRPDPFLGQMSVVWRLIPRLHLSVSSLFLSVYFVFFVKGHFPRPPRCRVQSTLGKMFTHMCLCHQAIKLVLANGQ